MSIRVFIDRGHGPNNKRPGVYDPGAIKGPEKEHAIVAKIASSVVAELDGDNEIEVVLTPELSIPDVVKFVNDQKRPGDLFFVFHMNSGPESADGLEVVVSYAAPFARLWEAEKVAERLAFLCGLDNRGVKLDTETPAGKEKIDGKKGLPIIRDTKLPAFLIEWGFVSDKEDPGIVKKKAADAFCRMIREIAKGELWK